LFFFSPSDSSGFFVHAALLNAFDTSHYSLCFLNPRPWRDPSFDREILSKVVMEEEVTTKAFTNTWFFFSASFYIQNVFPHLTEKFLRQGIEFWDYFSSTTDSSTGSGYDVCNPFSILGF